MEEILILGKGELYSSVIKYLFHNKSTDMITTIPYDQFFLSFEKQELNYQELSKLQSYKRIYLFPENDYEGMLLTSFMSEWYRGVLFLVTQETKNNFIYKKLGADYVIISAPHCRSYPWFPDHQIHSSSKN